MCSNWCTVDSVELIDWNLGCFTLVSHMSIVFRGIFYGADPWKLFSHVKRGRKNVHFVLKYLLSPI